MQVVFGVVYLFAAFLSISSAALVAASLFMPDRAPQSMAFLGISLAVIAVFLVIGVLLLGIQGQVARVAALGPARTLGRPVSVLSG
jgi:hypothetical protein